MDTKDWHPEFAPCFTPREMLDKGVFMDCHYNVAIKGMPGWWSSHDNVFPRSKEPDVGKNHYGVKSRQSLTVWQDNGWTTKASPLGWWQWYAHYSEGRRLPKEDDWQIKRWKSFVARHMGQINANCDLKDKECRPVQRQALLQWAWDSEKTFNDSQLSKNRSKLGVKIDKDLKVGKEDYIGPSGILARW